MTKPRRHTSHMPDWLGLFHRRRGARRRYGAEKQHSTGSAVSRHPRDYQYILALSIIAVITIACFNMAFFMADGLPTNPDIASRMAYLQNHSTLWQFGWSSWMASAIGLLAFCSLLLAYIPHHVFKFLGFGLIAIGIAPDITAEALYAFVLPAIEDETSFRQLDRVAMLLTGFVGNGAYCLGGLILNVLLFRNHTLSRRLLYFGLPSWLAGLTISLCTALNLIPLAAMFTGIAMTWNVLWMFLFTQSVLRYRAGEQYAQY